MKKIKTSLLVIGLVFAAIGMIWMGLGTGALRWPASSPMIGDHLWVTLGAGLAVMGLVLILLSRRLR